MRNQGTLPGDFDFTTLIGPCALQLEEMQPEVTMYGMPLHANYLFGGLHTADGEFFMMERKFVGAMTNGLNLMAIENGVLELLSENSRSTCGEVRRDFKPDSRKWSNNVMHDVGPDFVPGRGVGLDLMVDDQSLAWTEGDLMTLTGTVGCTGMQFFMPMAKTPCLLHEQPYHVKGVVLEKEVEGFVYLDHVYTQAGCDWKHNPVHAEAETTMTAFTNLLEDGTVEYGYLFGGRRGFNAGIVIEGQQVVACSYDLGSSATLENGLAVEGSYYFGDGAAWDFTPKAAVGAWAKARVTGYQCYQGVARRRGDTRQLALGHCWYEIFPDRAREEGQIKE
jgi:hypothetical protein